jgi:protein-tyrosine-phosphatase
MQVVSSNQPLNVLFLCTGNSARSIMGEVVLNRLGRGKFKGYSAGSQPAGAVNPIALQVLQQAHYDTSGLRSKSWDEFAKPGAPKLDFVFTVCDNAAQEVCPIWPGQPMTAHWGLPDPVKVEGGDAERHLAFADTLRMLTNRIGIFVSLPFDKLSKASSRCSRSSTRSARAKPPPRKSRLNIARASSLPPSHAKGVQLRALTRKPRRVDKPRRPSYVSRAAVPWHFLVAFRRFYAGPAGNGSMTLRRLRCFRPAGQNHL